MNQLLMKIRENHEPMDDEHDLDDQQDLVEYQQQIIRNQIKKYTECYRILKNLIETKSQEELETILCETDCYGATVLHYACRFHMKRIALRIIEHIHEEANLYTLSNIQLTPLIICSRAGKGKLDNVFSAILEKTKNEDYLYLGKNHALQFCIINRDTKKAVMVIEKTQQEKNLYKLGLRFSSLIYSLEITQYRRHFYPELLEISKSIIKKTNIEKNLYIPYSPFYSPIPRSQDIKTAFYYLKNPKYKSVLPILREKYETINGYRRMKINRIFAKNKQKIYLEDIIEYIASFLLYPPDFVCYFPF